jgi:hypothetical protein
LLLLELYGVPSAELLTLKKASQIHYRCNSGTLAAWRRHPGQVIGWSGKQPETLATYIATSLVRHDKKITGRFLRTQQASV